jgi:hypothetical protein
MAAPTTPPSRGGIFAASFIGTSIEWYDYYIFGTAAALVFGSLFFPQFSSVAGTLAAFATFAVGFVARPLGAAVIGHFGDRVGRKAMLVLTLLLTGGATAAIGLLPTYAAIGIGAVTPPVPKMSSSYHSMDVPTKLAAKIPPRDGGVVGRPRVFSFGHRRPGCSAPERVGQPPRCRSVRAPRTPRARRRCARRRRVSGPSAGRGRRA